MLIPTERHSYLPSTYEQGNTPPSPDFRHSRNMATAFRVFFQDFVISPKWWSSQKISLANCGCKLDMTVPPSPPPKKKKNRLSIFGYTTYWNLSQNSGDLEEKFPSKSGECEEFFFPFHKKSFV
jgi:hypothetical protein